MKSLMALLMLTVSAQAGDPSRWLNEPLDVKGWFSTVMRPDEPMKSCCGEGDAFEADQVDDSTEDGNIHAVITDGRGIIADHTIVSVPRKLIQIKYGNPTKHIIIFIGTHGVLCYVPLTGL